MVHELEIGQGHLDRLLDGSRTCELRYNDRDYQVGDEMKFYQRAKVGLGDWIYFKITHVLPVQSVISNCEGNYVVLSLTRKED
jgi:hypothetical protein